MRLLGLTDEDIATFQEKGRINPEITIFAPIAGTVVQRKIGPGQYVNAGASDPVFVIDEDDFRTRCREIAAAFGGGEHVHYAGKAFLCAEIARWVAQEGLCLDVATGGELAVALHAELQQVDPVTAARLANTASNSFFLSSK